MNSLQDVFNPLSGPLASRNRRRNPLWRFRRFLFVVALAMIAGVGAVLYIFSETPLFEDTFDELAQTSYICTAEVTSNCGSDNAAAMLSNPAQDRDVVEFEELPDHLVHAVVAVEDQTFFEHRGIDPKGISRAAFQSVRTKYLGGGGVVQGGSTITQQYVKLAYDDKVRNLSRKAREAVRAVKLENELTEKCASSPDLGDDTPKTCAKKIILTRYLNRAYFGRGASGVQAAARAYFDKDVGELELAESAFIVGLLRSPNGADPDLKFDIAVKRRSTSLQLMVRAGFITQEEAQIADASEWTHIQARSLEGLGEVKGSEFGSEYFIEEVRLQLNEIFPNTDVRTAGLRVYTTLDQTLQQHAYVAAHHPIPDEDPASRAKSPEMGPAWLDPANPDDPQASLVSVDGEGRVRAMLGGASFEQSQFNLATSRGGQGRQPGSTFKPIGLATALDQGFSANSLYEAIPGVTKIEHPQCANAGKPWQVTGGSSARNRYRSLVEATTWSSNVVYAQLVVDVGPDQVRNMANAMGVNRKLGIEQADGTTFIPCSIILGSQEVSVMDITAAYSTLERAGSALRPVLIERIENVDGEVICWNPIDGECALSSERQGEQVLDPSAARQTNNVLTSVVTSGTGKEANFSSEWQIAGKTGTSQNNRDGWFAGFTCDITTVVWVGHSGDNKYMINFRKPPPEDGSPVPVDEDGIPVNDRGWANVQGGNMPSWIWNRFMTAATAGKPPCQNLELESTYTGQVLNSNLSQVTLPPCGVQLDDYGYPLGGDPESFVYLPTTTTAPPPTRQGRQPRPQPNPAPQDPCVPPDLWAMQRDPGFVFNTTSQLTVPQTTETSEGGPEPSPTFVSTAEPPPTTADSSTTDTTADSSGSRQGSTATSEPEQGGDN